MSLKTASLIAAILARLITNRVEAIEPDVPDNSTSIERVLSNQELDSLDDPNSRVVLIKTGDSSPSVPTSPGRGQQSNFPIGTTGGRRTLHVNPYRTSPKLVDQGLGAAGNPAGADNGGHNGGELLNLMISVLVQKSNNHKNCDLSAYSDWNSNW